MTAGSGRPGRPCAACQHPSRRELDRRIVAGEGSASLAREYGLTPDGVARHRARHVAPALQAAAEREQAGSPQHGDDLLAEVRRLHRICLNVMADAHRERDRRGLLDAIGKATKLLETQGKLLHQIDQPAVIVVDRGALIQKIDGLLARLAPPRPTIEVEP